jgi:DNA polymerase-3 subunit epsilon
MTKLFFFDIETTGVNFWQHSIHQISGKIVIDGETKEYFDFKVRPHEKAKIEQKALDVGNVTLEQIMSYEPQTMIYSRLINLLSKYCDKFDSKDKLHLVGYNNAPFDNQFFRAFFTQCNDQYFGSWFWSDSLDVMVLSSNYLKDKRAFMPNFKLATVAKTLGIEVDDNKLHDAKYDIDLTEKIFNIVTQNNG